MNVERRGLIDPPRRVIEKDVRIFEKPRNQDERQRYAKKPGVVGDRQQERKRDYHGYGSATGGAEEVGEDFDASYVSNRDSVALLTAAVIRSGDSMLIRGLPKQVLCVCAAHRCHMSTTQVRFDQSSAPREIDRNNWIVIQEHLLGFAK